MTNWPVKTLGEVCEVARGTSITRKETKEGLIPVVAGGIDVAYFHSVQNRPAGTITVSSSGANAGFVNRWEIPIFASDCSTVVTKEGGMVLGDYAFRFLQFKQFFINTELRRGAAQPHVYAKDIAAIEIPVPPLEEQKRIVGLLDAATARVTELTACYEQARTHANNLFTSALSSALEDNPDWPTKTLSDISEISYGYTESAKSEAVGPKFLRITDIKNRGVNWDDVPYCPIDDVQLMHHRLGDGDIVFARTGATTGKSFLVAKPPLAVCASYLIRLRTDKKLVSPDFLNLNFQTNAYWKQVNEGMSGAAQGGFNASKLGALEIPVPPLEEQKKIVARLDSMRAKTSEMVAAYDAKLQAAKNLRQSILESAFEGKL